MSSPIILNQYLHVASYNGGPLYGKNGIENMIRMTPQQADSLNFKPHSTRNGTNFDLILDFKHETQEKFTLTHIVVKAPDFDLVTAPLKNGAVWVSDSATLLNLEPYNDLNEKQYLSMKDELTNPPTFFEFQKHELQAISVVPNSVRNNGTRLHIKYTSSFGEDNNIDMGPIFFVGYLGDAPASYKVPDVTTCVATADQFDVLYNLELVPSLPKPNEVNALNPQYGSSLLSSASILFISSKPIKNLDGKALEAYNELQSLSQTYHQKRTQFLNQKTEELFLYEKPAIDLLFFSVDPTTEKNIGKYILNNFSIEPLNKNSIVLKEATTEKRLLDPTGLYELEGIHFNQPGPDETADEDADEAKPEMSLGDFIISDNVDFLIAAYDKRVVSLKFLMNRQDISGLRTALKAPELSNIQVFIRSFLTVLNMSDNLLHSMITEGQEPSDPESFTAINSIFRRFLCSSNTPAGFTHPLYPSLYIGTAATFKELVLDNPDHTLVVLYSDSTIEFQQTMAMVCELSELLASYKINVRVVAIDATKNDVELEYFDSPASDPLRLFVKRPKLHNPKPSKLDKESNLAKEEVVEKPIFITSAGIEVYSHKFDFGVDEDEGFGITDNPGFHLPTVMSLINFIHDYVPEVLTPRPPQSFTTTGVKLENAIKSLSYCIEANVTIMANLRHILRVKGDNSRYIYPAPTSKTAKLLKKIKEIYQTVRNIRNNMPGPAGYLEVPMDKPLSEEITSRQITVPNYKGKHSFCLMVNDVADQLISLHKLTEANVMDIQDIFRGVRLCTNLIENFINTYISFPEVCKAFFASPKNEKLCQDFTKAWDVVRTQLSYKFTIPEGLIELFKLAKIELNTTLPDPTVQLYAVETELVAAAKLVQQFLVALSHNVSEEMKELETKYLHSDFRRIHSEKQLVRALEGFKILAVKLAKKGTKKTTEQLEKEQERVADINRLVVVYITTVSDGSVSILPELSQTMKDLAQEAKQRLENGVEGAHPVFFIKVDADECPDVVQMLDVENSFPTFIFTQSGAEIVDLRLEGVPLKDICSSLRTAISSFHDTSIEEEEYDEDMEDVENMEIDEEN